MEKLTTRGQILIILVLVGCFIWVLLSFKSAPVPPDYCVRIAKIGMTTEVWKVIDNGDKYIIVINEQKGSVAITKASN